MTTTGTTTAQEAQMQSPVLPIGLDWHKSIGSGHFAFGQTRDGVAVKLSTVCFGTLTIVETVDGDMMPSGRLGHFDEPEQAVDQFGIVAR